MRAISCISAANATVMFEVGATPSIWSPLESQDSARFRRQTAVLDHFANRLQPKPWYAGEAPDGSPKPSRARLGGIHVHDQYVPTAGGMISFVVVCQTQSCGRRWVENEAR